MSDLTDFLLARIAEDEAAAREAIDPSRPGTHWHWVRTLDDVPVDDPARDADDEFTYGLRTVEEFPTTSGVGDLPAFVTIGLFPSESRGHRHIARHDPARVLAECEAKRRIVVLHPIYRGPRIQPIDTSSTDFGCELCHRLDALHSDSPIEAIGYCDTLLALALPYADHPDYDPDWRP